MIFKSASGKVAIGIFLAGLQAMNADNMFQLKNANARRMQHETIQRIPFGNSDGDLNNEFSFLSW